MPSPSEVSRVVSHALRHEPARYGIELDEDGWASLDELVAALRKQGPRWSELDRDKVVRVITASSARRHELRGNWIRALYGHSFERRLTRSPQQPPEVLFHGTASSTLDGIIDSGGLYPAGRQYVHLSADRNTADRVGRRKASEPELLTVLALEAWRAGILFYPAGETVWLTEHIPTRFVEELRAAAGTKGGVDQ